MKNKLNYVLYGEAVCSSHNLVNILYELSLSSVRIMWNLQHFSVGAASNLAIYLR